jgi:trimeric autotransporter adhesin
MMKKTIVKKITAFSIATCLSMAYCINGFSQSTSHDANSVPVNGNENVAIGSGALASNNNGHSNTATGFAAMKNNARGSQNTALGFESLLQNSKGWLNTAIGYQSMLNNIDGSGNTAIGFGSMLTGQNGQNNTLLGHIADVGTDGLENATAIGYKAVVNASNTIQLGNASVSTIFSGVGNNALFVTGGLQVTGGAPGSGKVLTSDATGMATWQTLPVGSGNGWSLGGNAGTVDGAHFIGTTDNVPFNVRVFNQPSGRIETNINTGNTFWGYQSGKLNTGLFNTGHGYQTLATNTTGRNNTANGYGCLGVNTTGSNNTALGLYALRFNSTGGGNNAIGAGALNNNTSGGANVAVGGVALGQNTTGYGNTAVGNHAGLGNTTGTYNTAIGNQSVIGLANNNVTAVGAFASTGIIDNKVRIGGPAITLIEGQVNFSAVSDGRFKDNISDKDVQGLAFVRQLRPVVYNFNTKRYAEFLSQDQPDSLRKAYMDQDFAPSMSVRQHGFIAQEVAKTAESLGYDFDGVHRPENSKDYYSISYATFVVPLVKAVQEQQQMIEAQTKADQRLQLQIEELKKANEALQTTLQQQQAQLNSLMAEKSNPATTSAVLENKAQLLWQNAPNPFGQQTAIAYHVPQQAANAQMLFYNAAGQLVKTVKLATKGNGVLQVQASELSAGIYRYALSIDGKVVATQQMAKQ